MMIKTNMFLKNNITKIILIFLFLGPLFDLITSISLHTFKIDFNLVILIKTLVMMIFVYYLFFISKTKYKKQSVIYLLFMFIYFVLYFISLLIFKDRSVLMFEIQNLIRNFYFPIMLVCLFNIYQENEQNINHKKMSIILFSYILMIFIPTITKIGFNSYAYSKLGTVGWFNSTNEIGGILSILLPIGLISLANIKSIIVRTIILFISLFTYFSLGSKVPILSIGIIIICVLLRNIYKIVVSKKYKSLFIILVTSFIVLLMGIKTIPKTSFYKNIIIHLDFLEIDSLDDFNDIHIIDHFVFSERISFLEKTMINYNSSSIYEKIIGIGYIENYGTDEVSTKTIEMDYYDILFRNGILGFTIYFIPIIYLLASIYKKTIKLNEINNNLYMLYISLLLVLILSLFSGHIMVAPSVSIFIAIIISMINKELEV